MGWEEWNGVKYVLPDCSKIAFVDKRNQCLKTIKKNNVLN